MVSSLPSNEPEKPHVKATSLHLSYRTKLKVNVNLGSPLLMEAHGYRELVTSQQAPYSRPFSERHVLSSVSCDQGAWPPPSQQV